MAPHTLRAELLLRQNDLASPQAITLPEKLIHKILDKPDRVM
jgi:hypothetical protein